MQNNRSVTNSTASALGTGIQGSPKHLCCASAARFCVSHSSASLPGRARVKSRLPGFQDEEEFPVFFGKTADKGSPSCPVPLPGPPAGSSAAGKAAVKWGRKERPTGCSVTAEGTPQKLSTECAGSLSGAASSSISTPCSGREAADSSRLLAGPKDQPPLFKTLPPPPTPNSWHGGPNAGSGSSGWCGRNKHFPLPRFILLSLARQATGFKTWESSRGQSILRGAARSGAPSRSRQRPCQPSGTRTRLQSERRTTRHLPAGGGVGGRPDVLGVSQAQHPADVLPAPPAGALPMLMDLLSYGKAFLIFHELVAKCRTELSLEEAVSNLPSREVRVQRSRFQQFK